MDVRYWAAQSISLHLWPLYCFSSALPASNYNVNNHEKLHYVSSPGIEHTYIIRKRSKCVCLPVAHIVLEHFSVSYVSYFRKANSPAFQRSTVASRQNGAHSRTSPFTCADRPIETNSVRSCFPAALRFETAWFKFSRLPEATSSRPRLTSGPHSSCLACTSLEWPCLQWGSQAGHSKQLQWSSDDGKLRQWRKTVCFCTHERLHLSRWLRHQGHGM